MPVFDFNNTPDDKKAAECTYTIFYSSEGEATPEKPMMVLDNQMKKWEHHSLGMFTNPVKRTAFEFQQETGTVSADILKICKPSEMARRKSYQCPPVRREYRRRLCSLQDS